MIPRLIPVLLLADGGVVKTVRFREPRYVGDPINAVRILNDKEVDELMVLDTRASAEGRPPNESAITDIVSEAFMPVGYGGGIRDLETATRLIQLGVEKVVINTAAIEDPDVVSRIADRLGSSTLVVSIDAALRPSGGYEVWTHGGTRASGLDVIDHAQRVAALGAGELLLNAIDRDGTMQGYDLDLVRAVTASVDIPLVACGGAGGMADVVSVLRDGGASAAAAGSMFVFHGRHRAVLITYPTYADRAALLGTVIGAA